MFHLQTKLIELLNRTVSVFSDIDFDRDRNSKYYQGSCESKKDKQISSYYAENKDRICEMEKAYCKRNND